MNYKTNLTKVFILILVIFNSLQTQAQDDDAELAKKLSNPIASLISVPFQNNSDYGIGTLKESRNTLNFQPVPPVSLNDNLNMIARVVLPIVTQYNITRVGQNGSGVTSIRYSKSFSIC